MEIQGSAAIRMRREEIPNENRMAAPGPQGICRLEGSVTRSSVPSLPEDQPALIEPTREPGEEPVTPTVVLTFTQPDYQALCRLAQVHEVPRQVWGCAYRPGSWKGSSLTVVAPALGAPYAAMVLEKLIALGARQVLALGWCGSLSPQVHIGHLILPSGAIPGDGTSPHYCREPGEIPPHRDLYNLLVAGLRDAGIPWHTGPVWSTDAFYREPPSLVQSCRARGILGIDLELAALFAVGRFRQVAVAGLLVVSDELFALQWQPARGSQPFRQARNAALRLVLDAAAVGKPDV
jgi:uridine phosphorylase